MKKYSLTTTKLSVMHIIALVGVLCTAHISLSSANADIIQFGWKIEDPPHDGATRIIDWKGQYTNLTTGAYSASGSQGNFNGLTAAQGPHLIDPVTSLSLTGSQCWAYHELTNGTFESWAHAAWVKEGSNVIDIGESVAFAFNEPVKLHSLAWHSFRPDRGDKAEVSYAGNVETNTSPALYDLGETALAPGQELLIRALDGDGFRISAITVEVTPSTNTTIAPDDANIHYQGSQYITSDENGAYYQRHSDAVLALPSGTSGFNSTKARTTTGIAMLFRTDSASVDMDFTIEPGVENRGSTFAVYEVDAFLGTHDFSSAVSNMSFSISSASPGTASVYRVVFPNWSKPDFRGMQLDAGASLLPYTPPSKRSYVVLGDSISHGVGQASTYLTYPWLVAEMLDVELFNLAVGGGKVSIPSAEMLSEFPAVDVISILIGYNDLHFAEKSVSEFSTDLDAQIAAIRTHHADAELFCISQTFTTNPVNTNISVHISEYRQAVSNIVATRQAGGDSRIYLIKGEEITSAANLRTDDAVHFSEPGAAAFATNLFLLMDPIVNRAPVVVSPQAGTNVLFIAVDDMKPMLGCYGDALVQSPRIDGLASNGVTFLNAHCQWAVCGPSRASLMTGLMPEECGVMGFKKMRGLSESGTTDGEVTRANVVTLPQHFRYNGYRTTATGKINDNRCVGSITNLTTGKVQDDGRNVDDPPSWGDPVDPDNLPADFFTNSSYVNAGGGWSPAGKPATGATNLPDSAFADGKICDEGITLLNQLAAGDTQFFLGVGFKKPHLAFYAPQDCWDRYDRDDFDIHPFQDHPTNAVPYTWHHAGELKSYDDFNPSIPGYIDATNIPPAKQKELIHGYYACVSHIDDQVGRLLDALEAVGLHTNTIVVLWGDHGFHLGDHAEWGKHTNIEQATRVPMIIYSPFKGVAGATAETPANFTDLYPTICDLVGLPVPEQPLNEGESPTTRASGLVMKGSSLVPVMESPTSSIRTGALSIYRRSGAMGYSYRTKRHRLIEWISSSSKKTLARELYDYDSDPMETLNLAARPSYNSVLYNLSHAMRAEPEAAGCPILGASIPLTSPGTVVCFR